MNLFSFCRSEPNKQHWRKRRRKKKFIFKQRIFCFHFCWFTLNSSFCYQMLVMMMMVVVSVEGGKSRANIVTVEKIEMKANCKDTLAMKSNTQIIQTLRSDEAFKRRILSLAHTQRDTEKTKEEWEKSRKKETYNDERRFVCGRDYWQ